MSAHAVEQHKAAVAIANLETLQKIGFRGPYTPGTDAHRYWLSVYDRALLASRNSRNLPPNDGSEA